MAIYHIDTEIVSMATNVIIGHEMRTNQSVCLKMWLPCKNGVYDTSDENICTGYLLEGLAFNQRFAPNVYLGIAPVIYKDEEKREVRCGRLIKKPVKSRLKGGRKYTLVMERLDENRRLDRQLSPDHLGNEQGMEFLAQAVANMHKRLDPSPKDMGTPDRLLSKLHLNRQLFQKALDDPMFRNRDTEFRTIGKLLKQASKAYLYHFEQRHKQAHIRRCHGDLKATNLWVYPTNTTSQPTSSPTQRLVALDCVDFNPEFCHIDTLSDIAMLAIDLEMHLTSLATDSHAPLQVEKLAQHFLTTYLQATEKEDVWPLLEYYMTEKAMVCMYMSILFDGLTDLGEQYLQVALAHSKNLKQHLPAKKTRKKGTRLVVSTASGTTQHN